MPVRWTTGYSSCGRAEQVACSASIALERRCARRRAPRAGTPTPVSRLTWASSQARASPVGSSRGSLVGRRRARPRPRARPRRRARGRRRSRPASRTSLERRLERGAAARRCRARPPASPRCASSASPRVFALRTSPSTVGRDRVAPRGRRPRTPRASSALGHAARCTEPVAPPRPHLFGHERQDAARTAAAASTSAVRSAARADAAASSPTLAVRALLHQLDVVVAEAQKNRSVRSSARA